MEIKFDYFYIFCEEERKKVVFIAHCNDDFHKHFYVMTCTCHTNVP